MTTKTPIETEYTRLTIPAKLLASKSITSTIGNDANIKVTKRFVEPSLNTKTKKPKKRYDKNSFEMLQLAAFEE